MNIAQTIVQDMSLHTHLHGVSLSRQLTIDDVSPVGVVCAFVATPFSLGLGDHAFDGIIHASMANTHILPCARDSLPARDPLWAMSYNSIIGDLCNDSCVGISMPSHGDNPFYRMIRLEDVTGVLASATVIGVVATGSDDDN